MHGKERHAPDRVSRQARRGSKQESVHQVANPLPNSLHIPGHSEQTLIPGRRSHRGLPVVERKAHRRLAAAYLVIAEPAAQEDELPELEC